MGYQDDPVGYEQRLNAKLQPESIRATLGFAGLYQMMYEMLKWAVLDNVREFFSRNLLFGSSDSRWSRYCSVSSAVMSCVFSRVSMLVLFALPGR